MPPDYLNDMNIESIKQEKILRKLSHLKNTMADYATDHFPYDINVWPTEFQDNFDYVEDIELSIEEYNMYIEVSQMKLCNELYKKYKSV